MKIGIFGGAFNPVHNGHLNLIDSLSSLPYGEEKTALDKFLIIPTADPPHRDGADFAKGEDRINMLKLAVKNKICEISDIEFKLEGKSYTYNTLKALIEMYPNSEFYLFMGSDQFLCFKSWYRYEEIAKTANVIGFSRSINDVEKMKRFIFQNKELKMQIVNAEPYEMSSSEIREKIRNGESITGIVPEKVEEYIKEHGLYV